MKFLKNPQTKAFIGQFNSTHFVLVELIPSASISKKEICLLPIFETPDMEECSEEEWYEAYVEAKRQINAAWEENTQSH